MSAITSNSTKFPMIGGNLAIDFANHMRRLTNYPSIRDQFTILLSWLEQAELITKEQTQHYFLLWNDRLEPVQAFMQKAARFQSAVYGIFWSLSQGKSPEQENMRILNEHIKHSYAHLTIEETAQRFVWQWEQPGSLDDCLRPIVRSAAELLTSELLSRIRLCPGERCGWLFLDTSKNGSRKWCDMRDCGNVVKARNYRKRQSSDKKN